ncbi:MAG TPA: guanine deaminase [Polyangium sp.]|nr:guanine deaminase [Polyangium sp.]
MGETSQSVFRGRILTPIDGTAEIQFLEDALMFVDDRGKITAVKPYSAESVGDATVHDVRPWVISPGFVDAHLHYPQIRVIGSASGPLMEWLDYTVFPEESRFVDGDYARVVARELVERFVAVGTTTAVLYSSSSPTATRVLFETLAKSGLRAIAGLTLMDQNCPSTVCVSAETALEAVRELAAAYHGYDNGRLAFAITPRFAPTCSRTLLEQAAQLASDQNLYVQTHISENSREVFVALEVHPWARDYLDVYESTGLLGSRTLLAHAIHLSSLEWDRVRMRDARIVHCPDSNFFLGSGHHPLTEPESRGIPVALGTDVAAGRTFDVRRIMSSAYDNALCLGNQVLPEKLFRLGTLGGAEAIGLGKVIGSLEPGKEADFCLIDVPAHVQVLADVLSRIVFSSDTTPVRGTYVRGKRLD